MTAPAGYIRSRCARERSIDRAWRVLRGAQAPLAAAEIAERADASRSGVKRLLQAARDAGWIEIAREFRPAGPRGGRRAPLYRLTDAAPVAAPILRCADVGAEAMSEGTLSGTALGALRRRNGWSLAETARQIGVADIRTVRRYEDAARLPPAIAERVEALARAEHNAL